MKPKKISANPLYQRHPRSMNPYTNLKAALNTPQTKLEEHMQDDRRFAKLRRALSLRAITCRFLISALIFTLLIPLADCKVTKTVRLDPSEVREPGKEKIVGVTTADGQDVRFDSGAVTLSGDTLRASV